MQAAEALDGAHADLALVFLSADHAARAEEVSATVHRVLTPAVLAGTTTVGAIGGDRELEDSPGLSVLAAALPGAAEPRLARGLSHQSGRGGAERARRIHPTGARSRGRAAAGRSRTASPWRVFWACFPTSGAARWRSEGWPVEAASRVSTHSCVATR